MYLIKHKHERKYLITTESQTQNKINKRLQTQVQRACCEQVRFGQGEKKGIMTTNDLQN